MGKPLVLLHSLLADRSIFDKIVPALAQQRRVIVPDLPGFGASSSAGATIEGIADRIAGLFDALAILEEQGAAVALMITDIVLPHVSGAELAMRARPRWPRLQVLFTSGYPVDALNLVEVERLGVPLLAKPYTSAILLFEVRLRLDGATAT